MFPWSDILILSLILFKILDLFKFNENFNISDIISGIDL